MKLSKGDVVKSILGTNDASYKVLEVQKDTVTLKIRGKEGLNKFKDTFYNVDKDVLMKVPETDQR